MAELAQCNDGQGVPGNCGHLRHNWRQGASTSKVSKAWSSSMSADESPASLALGKFLVQGCLQLKWFLPPVHVIHIFRTRERQEQGLL